MPGQDLTKFPMRRLNPFKGLLIDVPTWASAHDYHRDQQRLHGMAAHGYGVVTGLEVLAFDPPDNSVVVCPGVALDPEGNAIVVPESQRFYMNTDEAGTARVIIRYSEVAEAVTEVSGNGTAEPAYIVEAFRVEERRGAQEEPHVELARVSIRGKKAAISNAYDVARPQPNEIDTRFRTVSGPKPEGQINIGLVAYPGGEPVDGWNCHWEGIFNLAQSVQRSTVYSVQLLETVELADEAQFCRLLCMAGHQEFQLSETEEKTLGSFLDKGGLLFAEACAGAVKGQKDRAKGFRSSFASLCASLGRTLRPIERGHPLFHSYHIFGSLPEGCEGTAVVMESDGIIYSDADYGCVWAGGREDKPLSRDSIRDALEFGVNIAAYSHQRAQSHLRRATAD